MNSTQLAADLADVIHEAATNVLNGTAADLRDFATRIAFDSVQALLLPPAERDAALAENLAQMRLLAEAQRIRATNAAWDTFAHVTTIVARTAVAALTASLPL